MTNNQPNSQNSGPATVRVREPRHMVEAVPYLLGFHPDESAVMIGLEGSGVGLTVRVDLDAMGTHAARLAAADAIASRGMAGAVLVVWTRDRLGSAYADGAALTAALQACGVAVAAVLVTDGTQSQQR